ncbi:hypothetical protein GWK47_010480 [Chionoecetes opilio]|uniref:Uncharacterized protein n=1 Tax=Chionoecetes opilio TaxID=41210 RepID=A0A8J4XX27_CHIOP|nr:hypothetical protein GWK47_010480 [Chionoecetes opilio]
MSKDHPIPRCPREPMERQLEHIHRSVTNAADKAVFLAPPHNDLTHIPESFAATSGLQAPPPTPGITSPPNSKQSPGTGSSEERELYWLTVGKIHLSASITDEIFKGKVSQDLRARSNGSPCLATTAEKHPNHG